MYPIIRAGLVTVVAILTALLAAPPAQAERLKDLANLAGVRNNPLVGYGLVVGLDGSGDQTTQTPFTAQSFRNMLKQFGVVLPPGVNFQLKNVAAVTVHATLPAFVKPGQHIDVSVSSIGNAKSLRGGSLLLTPLQGPDGEVYAIAQGQLVVGGFGAEGSDGSKVTVNVPSAGRIPNGGIVERAVPNGFMAGNNLVFNLHRADFTTAKRVAESINELLGPDVARAVDAMSVYVTAPRDADQRVTYMSVLENIEVEPGESPARVVINSRTGTIVVGDHVTVQPVAVTHGNLVVTIAESLEVSQPNALAGGNTVVVPQTGVQVEQEASRMFSLPRVTTLADIVRAVNQVGAAPGDLMAIIEALKEAGALNADLVVI
ncbi:MAG: flagellar basal body P-ring protein FlgI [Spongiibacteraceae bacterium]|jgi:flagellar P-ring protein precursor FlgI|nr:flagellar basal body P-ring protein FlgI [Spongiibacteraceae bacterium]